MSIKDSFRYAWQRPAFGLVRGIYVRPGSSIYTNNYEPDGKRRVLFSRGLLKEKNIPQHSSNLNFLLNITLSSLGVDESLDFFNVEDMDRILKNEDEEDLKYLFRGAGEDFYKSLTGVLPEDFDKAYRIVMMFYDLVLGSRHEDVEPPEPGFAHYQYDEESYPFIEGSPSEKAVWDFAQGAASELHTFNWVYRDMDATITRKDGKVDVLSKDMG